jgi:hypothetical protein
MARFVRSKVSLVISLVALAGILAGLFVTGGLRGSIPNAHAAPAASAHMSLDCAEQQICADVVNSDAFPGYSYVGHDEPSVLFYSNTPGSGNSNLYRLTLPKDPPTTPKQDGSGGTFNFQLHPAFWFGMAMCDTQSAPEFTNQCTPDSDTNIFDNADPTAPDYIGHHPGTAFMEMQFYPPGWVGWPFNAGSCDPVKWCAALNIDSLSQNQNTGQINNSACLSIAGIEPVNFAFITKNGVAQAPANPVDSTIATFTPSPSKDLMMESGDTLIVDMHDTPAGFQVIIHDLTKGTSGSMTASIANGFGQVVFDPNATTCTVNPYAFHPMYSTSSEHTRVPWAAHSYNVAFSDEIGHFEYCNAVDGQGGSCTQDGVHDTDATNSGHEDDNFCFAPPFKPPIQSSRVKIGGCTDTDADFDGVPYQNTWPGTFSNHAQDAALHPTSILFTSPKFNGTKSYDRVAFEADLPRIENDTIPVCQRFVANPASPNPGAGCVNPPAGASFYPFYSTGTVGGQCVWQLGGANIPGTTNTFGGSSAEYGPLLLLAYPAANGQATLRFNDFRQVLANNPC